MRKTIKICVPDASRIAVIYDEKKGSKTFFDSATGIDYVTVNIKGDAFDLHATNSVSINGPKVIYTNKKDKNGKTRKISTGKVAFSNELVEFIPIQLPDGYCADLRTRSSTYNDYNVTLANGVGLIDWSYRGKNDVWKANVIAYKDTTIEKGKKVCQFEVRLSQRANFYHKFINLFVSGFKFEFVSESDWIGENRGGFGSTN